MNYIYSAKKNLFFPNQFKEEYESNGDWPDDAVPIDDKVFYEFTSYRDGKRRVAGEDGMPAWEENPALNHEQLVALSEQQKSMLRKEADAEIAWRQDAVDSGVATEDEEASLAEWRKYRILLMRVDTEKAPDVEFPPTPGS